MSYIDSETRRGIEIAVGMYPEIDRRLCGAVASEAFISALAVLLGVRVERETRNVVRHDAETSTPRRKLHGYKGMT